MTLRVLSDYGRSFQLKVIGALLTDKKFLLDVSDVLKESLFNSSAHQWIIQEILKYFREFHTNPTMEVLQIEFKKIENDVLKVAVKEELRHAYEASTDDLQYVKEEFTAFCRNQEMKNAILESADLLKNEDYEGIRNRIQKALKAGQEKSIGHEYRKDVESRYREDYRPTIPTPWPVLNDVHFDGGLGPGDLFLIFGGPGIGKSWLAIDIAANAVQLGYNVIYYTLELSENYVARRFDSYLTGYTADEVKNKREEIDELMKRLPGNLIVKEYAPKTATLGMIESHMQQCTDEGFKPDLIVVDYLDYVRPAKSTRYSERKDEIDDVYVGAKALAKTWGIPVISPSQVNRSGARDQVVEGDKAAGSYDKLMVADGAISLSRQKEDKALGTGRIHVMKTRYGADGITYDVRINTGNGHIEFEGNSTGELKKPEEGQQVFHLNKQIIAEFFNN